MERGDRIENISTGKRATVIYTDHKGIVFVIHDSSLPFNGVLQVDPVNLRDWKEE